MERTHRPMDIYLQNHNGHLQFHFESHYASGSQGIANPQQLVEVIEDVCGKGSFCLYIDKTAKYPNTVSYLKTKGYWDSPITYWQQGVKTQVIEQCRDVAYEVWGDIPEMKIGWLENQCRSYFEDLDPSVQSLINHQGN